jgi:hypothetical protein
MKRAFLRLGGIRSGYIVCLYHNSELINSFSSVARDYPRNAILFDDGPMWRGFRTAPSPLILPVSAKIIGEMPRDPQSLTC